MDEEEEEDDEMETTGRPYVNPLIPRDKQYDLDEIAKLRFNYHREEEIQKLNQEREGMEEEIDLLEQI